MRGSTHNIRLFVTLCVLFLFPSFASAEVIRSYDVDITIREDATIKVLETIEYDFERAERRGIFRDIPTKYKTTAGNRSVDLEVVSVSRNGFPEPFKVSGGSDVRVRVGDPDVYISGPHVYRITYEVAGAFNGFEEFDELYWNAIGANWNVTIQEASVSVTAPTDFVQATCYEGLLGANIVCADSSLLGSTYNAETIDLTPGNGLTIAVALPKGVVTLPTPLEEGWKFATDNIIVLLPLFVLAFMYRKWDKDGRDAKGTGTIITQYEPPHALSPFFMGAIMDTRLDSRDIAAGILYLAEQGYIHITRESKKRFLMNHVDYKLTIVGNIDELNDREHLLLKMLFGGIISKGVSTSIGELKKDRGLVTRRAALQKRIQEDLRDMGYYTNKPSVARATGALWGGLLILLVVIGAFFNMITPVFVIAMVISGIIIGIFAYLMPKMTKKGALTREHIEGYKKFLEVTEKDRLAFHNAPERTGNQFMAALPYAVAFGVEENWADQFKDLDIEEPEWYSGGSYAAFNPAAFTSDISSFNTSMQAGVTAAAGGSGSSGGGSVGGGFGGGGGGSW